MSRRCRRVSRSGFAKITRAISCGWRPGCGGPGAFLRLRRVRRARGGAL